MPFASIRPVVKSFYYWMSNDGRILFIQTEFGRINMWIISQRIESVSTLLNNGLAVIVT